MKQSVYLLFVLCLLAACAPMSMASPSAELSFATPAQANQAKTELRYATAFQVEYRHNYKVVTVLKPWRNAGTTFTYILVQRGTPMPTDLPTADNTQIIEIPVRSVASLAATHLPYLDEIDELDSLVAIGNAPYVSTPGVIDRLQSRKIKTVGNGPDVNVESLLDLNPDMITTLALGSSSKDDYQQLMHKGFKVVIFSDFMEESPLGRAEWVKFIALFFNKEEQAEKCFSGVEQRYNEMKALAAGVSKRPTVLLGYEINGKWNMPGGKSYQATYVKDAGGDYLWADDQTSGRIPLSFEAVLDKGIGADFWFDQSVSWKTAQDVLAADARYQEFNAFRLGQAYNNNARLNSNNGNEYNGSGLANPDLILADLISILHPELLPDHPLIYYRALRPEGS